MSNNSSSAILTLLLILGIGVIVLIIVAWCKIFKKAGIHPGMFFIPGYGAYLCYRIADSGALFFIQLAISVGGSFIASLITNAASRNYYSYGSNSLAGIGIMYVIIGIILLIINIIYFVNLSKSFGKSGGFAVGLLFLFPIFICILGFGSAQYYGSAGYASKSISTDSTWICPNCGAENPGYKGVCECGTFKP